MGGRLRPYGLRPYGLRPFWAAALLGGGPMGGGPMGEGQHRSNTATLRATAGEPTGLPDDNA